MFLNRTISTYTASFSDKISELRSRLDSADAVVIGAGAGLSSAAGLTYSGERFEKYFADFIEKYGFTDMYSGGFYPFESPEEFWAYWSRYIFINRYSDSTNGLYDRLLELVNCKEYFVLTTNVDHQFQKAGFDKLRLFYTQGDYGLIQCSEPCHNQTYDNETVIRRMFSDQEGMRIPSELVPVCPKCGRPMAMNLRADDSFVQDSGWYAARTRYVDFITKFEKKKVLLLELGVGFNTPGIIKFPFCRMTEKNPNAFYGCINFGETYAPKEIADRSVCIDSDICRALETL